MLFLNNISHFAILRFHYVIILCFKHAHLGQLEISMILTPQDISDSGNKMVNILIAFNGKKQIREADKGLFSVSDFCRGFAIILVSLKLLMFVDGCRQLAIVWPNYTIVVFVITLNNFSVLICRHFHCIK